MLIITVPRIAIEGWCDLIGQLGSEDSKRRDMEMRRIATVTIVIAWATTGIAASSGDWNLRRNTSNGACSVQPADSQPQLGAFLAKHPTRKAACEDARSRKTDDAVDGDKCFTYTAGTKDACQKEGIDLKD